MDINCLLEMASSIGNNIDLKSNLVTSTSKSSQEFDGAFDIAVNQSQDIKVVDKQVTNENKSIENKDTVSTKNTKVDNDDKVTDIDDSNVDFEKVEIEDDEKIDDATCESFMAILNLMNENKIDLTKYFDVNEDGTYEIKIENIDDLKLEIQNYFDTNNINIDLSILDEDQSFNFDNVIENALDFIADETNKQVTFNNVFVKDIDNDKVINIEDLVEVDSEVEQVNINEEINTNEKVQPEIIEETKVDDFEILKNTINEMIDSVEVVDSENINDETNVVFVDKNINKDDKVEIKEDDNEVETFEVELSDVKEETYKVNESEESGEKDFDHEDKKEHKDVKRIKIENNKSEYSLSVDDEKVKFTQDNLKDVIKENHISESVTDRYMEVISVAKQMVKGVELKLSEATQEMNIKLDPENLGKVNLKIVTENGLVTAKFEAENQKVKEIIESNLSLLKESLEKRGVEVSALNVSVNQNMNQNQNKNDIDTLRKITQEKNPHKILGKTIKNFITSAEINNSELKRRGLYMTRSQINYIA